MPRRKLNSERMLAGVLAALRSKRTPPNLCDGLNRRAAFLADQIKKSLQAKTEDKSSSPNEESRK
jgi:hypothetical protein